MTLTLMMKVRRTYCTMMTRSYLFLSESADKRGKCMKCSERRPNGVSSIGFTELFYSCLGATFWLFHFTTWSVSRWGSRCLLMLKTTNSLTVRSTCTENLESRSFHILKTRSPGSLSHQLLTWLLTQGRQLWASTKCSIDLIGQLLESPFTRYSQRRCHYISTRYSAFALKISCYTQMSLLTCRYSSI